MNSNPRMIVVRRRVAYAMFLGLLAIGLSGCSTDTGDQTNNRLKDLPYTIDVVGQEYVSRYQAMKRPNSEGAKFAAHDAGTYEHDGGGPSRAPQTLEVIADDILTKLRRVDTLPKSQQVPALENWLKSSSKLDEKSIETLIAAIQRAAALEPVES